MVSALDMGWVQHARHELLVFAAFWFVVGAFDELIVDLAWFWLRLTRRARTAVLPATFAETRLTQPMAVLIPAWHEDRVIGATIGHMLRVWRDPLLRVYVGCYANDPATLAAVVAAAGGDPRLRLVVHGAQGPTTKADCLNRLYRALCADEARTNRMYRGVVLHDAEDMVHPAGLAAIARGLEEAEFVQLPVRPEPRADSPWIAGHYLDEFSESHAKAMVVRDALGAALPAAGVGCGFDRAMLSRLAGMRIASGESGPFAAECLTEDYELGVLIARAGGRQRFLRLRDHNGALVATRSYFPATLTGAVRQKARWLHGIALQGWDRLGWSGGAVESWMAARDRRGPLSALVLAVGYLLVVSETSFAVATLAGLAQPLTVSPLLMSMLVLCSAAFIWRIVLRAMFVAREYGWSEGLRAVVRVPLANIIAIVACRVALADYVKTLGGGAVRWDKTEHNEHPALAASFAA